MDLDAFKKNGFVSAEFPHKECLAELQALIKSQFPCPPVEWHLQPNVSNDQHVAQVKKAVDSLVASGLVQKLIAANKEVFIPLTGEDLDIQSAPHLRVTRPEKEGDMVDWHRDSFYGSTPWELNIWFPVFPLSPGAGLRVLPGSHAIPSTPQEAQDQDEFRKSVA